MKKVAAMVVALLLAACGEHPDTIISDRCAVNDIFQQCMKSLPTGPSSTHYNDWSEVVTACQDVAYRHSLKKRKSIEPMCQGN